MSAILAIESDRTRQTLLKALVREYARTEVKMVDTVKAAILSFAETKPDLIIAPALLSPADSEELAAHVKAHAEPHVQMLTISALDVLRESAPDEEQRFTLFKRRPVSLGLQYDPHMVGRQIADRLERARVLRAEYEAAPRPTQLRSTLCAPTVVRPVKKTAAAAGAMPKDRRWAHRTPQQSPWVWTVRLPWGAEVDLVNISRTGVLLESGSKVSPGVALELQLSGVGVHRAVVARFVRSEVARVDRRGVRYHAAAQFDQPLDILPAQTEVTATLSTAESLAQLVTSALADLNQPERASIRFARGLRGLLRARDVLIRRSPIASPDDTESIYFHVRGEDATRTILQVIFERNRALTADEFKLLKAAASVTAGVLELEQLGEDTRQPAGRMSEVA
jgi:DNA-binding response OmpR family regulator